MSTDCVGTGIGVCVINGAGAGVGFGAAVGCGGWRGGGEIIVGRGST